MKKQTHTLEDSIRAEAYLLSEKAGHPPGMAEIFWLQAEALVQARAAAAAAGGISRETEAAKKPTGNAPVKASASPRGKKSGTGKILAVR